ncbi:MAG: FTR1 family iron permease [Elusimicrobiota bacterium]
MLAGAIIVFREFLEAALVVAVILGATKGIKRRGSWVGWGIVCGTLGAGIVAALMGRISQSFSGTGQSIFEACVLLLSVAMLGWHNIWMSKHGKKIARELRDLGQDVGAGKKSLAAIFTAVAIAVLREGSEIALFLYGIAAGGVAKASLLAGAALGVASGLAVGFALYYGLMKIPVKYFFRATGWMILLLAAGMASEAASFLNQAGLLPSVKDSLWNTSWLLSAQSLPGTALKTLIGYTPNPSGIQIIFYVSALVVIGGLMKISEG